MMKDTDFYSIGEQPKPFFAGAKEEVESFFGGLPFFQPWVWKMFAAVGIVSFLIGIGIGVWADLSMSK